MIRVDNEWLSVEQNSKGMPFFVVWDFWSEILNGVCNCEIGKVYVKGICRRRLSVMGSVNEEHHCTIEKKDEGRTRNS